MVSKVVAIAGGTGNLGQAIVERIVASGKFKVFVLAREVSSRPSSTDYTVHIHGHPFLTAEQASETKSKELGADVLAIDYTDVNSIVKVLEDHKIDTLISTLGSMFGQDPELALIQAADKSKSTKRYIPSAWGIKYTAE